MERIGRRQRRRGFFFGLDLRDNEETSVNTIRLRVSYGVALVFLATRPVSGVEPFKIALRFISDKEVKPETGALTATPFAVGEVGDARGLPDASVVGESQAKLHASRPVVSLTPVTEFVDHALRASLTEWKANVKDDAGLTLRCEILQLQVMEQHRVTVDARFRFSLVNHAGETVWKDEVAGDDGVWGGSLSEKNYLQAFSTATKRALADLFDKTGFRGAVKP